MFLQTNAWVAGILSVVLLLTTACGEGASRESSALKQQIAQQIWASGEAGLPYHKTVIDLSEEGVGTEDTLYAAIPMIVMGETASGEDSLHYLLLRDLTYAFAQDAKLRPHAERMQVQQIGDTLVASVRPNETRKATLIEQKNRVCGQGRTVTICVYPL